MRTRILIGIAVTTLVVSLAVAGGFWRADRASSARASGPAAATQQSAVASSAESLPERPVVPEPEDPVGTEVAVPAEPLTRLALEPRRAGAPAPVPRPAADRVMIAVVVLTAPSRVAEPGDPVPAGDADLAERLVVPALSPVELRVPSLPLASSECRGAARGGAL